MSDRIPTVKVPTSGGGALVASRVLATRPCTLVGLIINNTGAAQFIQLFESATVPANGAVPDLPAIAIAAAVTVQIDFGPDGIDFDKLAISNSTTAATKTIGAADCGIVAIMHA